MSGEDLRTQTILRPGQSTRRSPSNRLARVQIILLLAAVVAILILPFFTPYPPTKVGLGPGLSAPSAEHWFGLDPVGRDLFSRTLDGVRTSVLAGSLAVVVGLAIGLPLGVTAGFWGGRVDNIITRVVGILQTIPGLILAMAIVGITGRSLVNAMIAIGIVFVPRFYRIVRASALSVSAETFVLASRSMGSPSWRTMLGHVMPAVLSATVVQATVTMAVAVLSEATLSFVGLGVQPPDASLGTLLAESNQYLGLANHLAYLPGISMVLVVLLFTAASAVVQRALEKGESR